MTMEICTHIQSDLRTDGAAPPGGPARSARVANWCPRAHIASAPFAMPNSFSGGSCGSAVILILDSSTASAGHNQNPYLSLRNLKAFSPPSMTWVIASRTLGTSIAPSILILPPDWSPDVR